MARLLDARGFLRWVKARNRRQAPVRWLLRAALVVWKLARELPLTERICVNLTSDGHRMRVRLFSYDDLLSVSPDYESCLAEVLPPRGGVAVDAGAFIGRHTLAYARAVGPAGRVVAVEPMTANFRLLEHNVRQNGYDHVVCVACALGRDQRETRLTYQRETSTASTVRELPRAQRVMQQSLDHVLRELGIREIDFLKIDVEGSERDVLEGSTATLAASPKVRLVIEIHARRGASDVATCAVGKWLKDRGYTIVELREANRLFYLAEAGTDRLRSACHTTTPRAH